MANGFVKFFLPKDKVFYTLFEEATVNLMEMGAALIRALDVKDPAERNKLLLVLDNLEHKNDEVTHRIFVELGQNFITPFDREDIHALATALDDVADYIWGSGKRMINYHLEEPDDVMRQMAQIIDQSIHCLHAAIRELRTMKNIHLLTENCVKINSLENDADDLLDKSIAILFSSNMSPIDLIRKKDLFEELELVTDKCEDAANVIESIIVKYA